MRETLTDGLGGRQICTDRVIYNALLVIVVLLIGIFTIVVCVSYNLVSADAVSFLVNQLVDLRTKLEIRLSASARPDGRPTTVRPSIHIPMAVALVDMAPSSILVAAAGNTCHPGRAGVVRRCMGEQCSAICAVLRPRGAP